MTISYSWSLFLLRFFLGLSFAVHGYVKFSGGIVNTSNWFNSLGLPGIFAYGVALLEVMGGLALMAGLATRLLSALYIIVMAVAIIKVKMDRGFLGGYELELSFLAISLALLVSGGGRFSVDHMLFPSRKVKESHTAMT